MSARGRVPRPGDWRSETLYDDVEVSFRADRVLFEDKTEHQDLVLFENARFGRVLMLDGVTQVTTADEFVYHEMMAHTPILAHGNAKRVLVIGGGDGGTIREVLRHESVEHCTLVEIDEGVVTFSKKYLAEISDGAFDDPRLTLAIADGARFVAETEERFDVIIVDSTDPHGPGAVLFSKAFYRNCQRTLTPGGVMVTQNGVPFTQAAELKDSVRHFRDLFGDGTCFICTVPTYVWGQMALGWASDNAALREVPVETLKARFEAAGLNGRTRYYTPEVHKGAFALPPYIGTLLDDL
ncbi:polyamine aminopropyltransferase [Futiania mangrovi]|uniref:Polyamine aminopropyltransferase n=1 Tax=Futiania mangrovi TaxID=2959716 RepID=A0A9J6PF09_9PROT|nr:polyamine aminopropyltransferase [Futiania mangrovii]MCP1337289.1 polyamine aminopropyltransferase [Futiania mangrovii]